MVQDSVCDADADAEEFEGEDQSQSYGIPWSNNVSHNIDGDSSF